MKEPAITETGVVDQVVHRHPARRQFFMNLLGRRRIGQILDEYVYRNAMRRFELGL